LQILSVFRALCKLLCERVSDVLRGTFIAARSDNFYFTLLCLYLLAFSLTLEE